jgi:antitoxin component YwqK of YwqJK toxin-antitoxin module
VFFFIFFILFLNKGFGCDCEYNNNSLIEKNNSYNAIFRGKIIAIDSIEINQEKFDAITFIVSKNYKGIQSENVTIYQEARSSCSFTFNIGEEWVVWAGASMNLLYTNICTKTNKIDNVSNEDLKFIEDISNADGYKVWYDQNNDKIAEGFLSKTVTNGRWIYYSYGFIKSAGFYDNGYKDGKWICYYDIFLNQKRNKNLELLTNIPKDKQSNMFQQINYIINYKKGTWHGEQIHYNVLGEIKFSSMYKNNQLNGTLISYENGKTKNIYSYKNDKLNGMWVSFFENGTIELLCYYENGKQKGRWELYNRVGKIICSSKNNKKFPKYSKGWYYCD